MQTLKKRDIKGYKPKGKIKKVKDDLEGDLEETEIVDELVNGLGGSISGDEKNVNNSEIKTAPQNTTDQHADTAIQPNRPLYNVNSIGGRSMGSRIQASYKIAKDKAITLLEDLDTDFNNNSVIDIKEIGNMDVKHKVTELVKTLNGLGIYNDSNEFDMIINYMKTQTIKNA
jgi:hypothetical protein